MLSAKFLRPHSEGKHGRLYMWGEQSLNWMTAEYERGLRWVLRRQRLVLTITILTFGLNVYLYVLVPKGFFPQQDTGRVGGQIRGQQDVSFDAMKQKVGQISAIVQQDPGVQNLMSFVGGGGPGGGGGNSGSMFIFLKPDAERQKTGDTAEVILNRLRPKTSGIPGAQLYLQSQQELRIGGRNSATQYQYSLTSDNLAELNAWSPKLMAEMQKLPQLKDVATDQQEQGLRAQLVIDRDTASRLGVSPLAIDATLSDAFGQKQVSTTYRPLNQYHVVMEVDQQYQQDPDAIKNIYVKSTTGAMIPLSAVTHFETQRIPLTVNHQSQSPATTLSFNLTLGASLSDATDAIEQTRINIGMPSTIRGGFQGTAQAFQASLSSEPYLILLAIVAVYIVLGILYESFIHPLTILSTLPSAGVGAILALLIFNIDLSVIAMIGIILLIGIVKKNAIMMIDFALVAEREQGKTPEEAIYEACLLRFRPIMMTTMAALLGGLPLALGRGTGSELRRPLGVTIVGGLIVSQALTLFTTPVVYLFFDRLRLRFEKAKSRTGKRTLAPEPQPAAGDIELDTRLLSSYLRHTLKCMGLKNHPTCISSAALRRELSARNLRFAEQLVHESTYGSVPCVIYAGDANGAEHGNFLGAAYRRIMADHDWCKRLKKTYTAGRSVARRHDRWRAELDCANSSDALLMNVFCYPGMMRRPGVCRLLGADAGLRPEFGVRVHVPFTNGRRDRTEVDMQLGEYLVEAKLTETGFQQARPALVERYRDLYEVFHVDMLPRLRADADAPYAGYQLIRGVLAAHAREQRFMVLCDGRRESMVESWFRVIGAVRRWELRDRLRLLTWQELAAETPQHVRNFLWEKYGIAAG